MTGQPEHTPSPWNLVVDEKTLEFSIEDENGVTIVEGVLDTPSCRADADLIVAAPDLLKATKALKSTMDAASIGHLIVYANSPLWSDMQKAIAKAEVKE